MLGPTRRSRRRLRPRRRALRMLAGVSPADRRPWRHAAHVNAPPPRPRDRRPELRGASSRSFKALAKERADRYQPGRAAHDCGWPPRRRPGGRRRGASCASRPRPTARHHVPRRGQITPRLASCRSATSRRSGDRFLASRRHSVITQLASSSRPLARRRPSRRYRAGPRRARSARAAVDHPLGSYLRPATSSCQRPAVDVAANESSGRRG